MNNLHFECVQSKDGWAVEAIDHENEGTIDRVLFMGTHDEQLAKEYAEWKNRCACGDREASKCPGEWEPGCDLGSNPMHAKVWPPSACQGSLCMQTNECSYTPCRSPKNG